MSGNSISNNAAGATHAAPNQPTENGVNNTPVDFTNIQGAVAALCMGLTHIPPNLLLVCKTTRSGMIRPALHSFKQAFDHTQATLNPKIKTPETHAAYPPIESIIKGFQAHQDPSQEENKLAPLSEGELYLKALNMLFDAVGPKELRNFRRLHTAPEAWRTALTEFLSHPIHGLADSSSQLWKLSLAELNELQKHYPPLKEDKIGIGQIIFKIKSEKDRSINSINTISRITSNTYAQDVTNWFKSLHDNLKQDLEIATALFNKDKALFSNYLKEAKFNLNNTEHLKSYQTIGVNAITQDYLALSYINIQELDPKIPHQRATLKLFFQTAINKHGIKNTKATIDNFRASQNIDIPKSMLWINIIKEIQTDNKKTIWQRCKKIVPAFATYFTSQQNQPPSAPQP